MTSHPPLFISHGAPTLPLQDVSASRFLRGLGQTLTRPEAILVVSAHWETERPTVNAVALNETIHDFHGFPEALYRMRYPAPGSQDLADRTAALLTDAGFPVDIDRSRGLDHGAWVPLILAYPDADIPVVQLSVQPRLGPAHHLAIGRALGALADEGVLILASGSFTHNLRELDWRGADSAEPEWSSAFADWMSAALAENRVDDLVNYRDRAPYAVRNHPTDEHLLPIYVALGAAGAHASTSVLHRSVEMGALHMDAFAVTPSQI